MNFTLPDFNSFFGLSRKTLFNSLFVLLPTLWFTLDPSTLSDLAIWILQGREILKHKSVFFSDSFSALSTREMVYPTWGASVMYALTEKFFGLSGVLSLHKIICALIYGLILRIVSLKEKQFDWNWVTLALASLTIYGSSLILVDRPALLAVLPFLGFFYFLEKEDQISARSLFWVCVLEITWVNLHGSFLLGILMLFWNKGILLMQKRITLRSFVTAAFVILASAFINPFTWKVFPFLVETAKLSQNRNLAEWGTTGLVSFFPYGLVYFGLVLFLILYWVRSALKARPLNRQLLSLFVRSRLFTSSFFFLLLFGFTSIRQTVFPYFLLLTLTTFIEQPRELAESRSPRRTGNLFLVLALLFAVILFSPYFKERTGFLLPEKKRPLFEPDVLPRIAKVIAERARKDDILFSPESGSALTYFTGVKGLVDIRNIIFSDTDFFRYFEVAYLGRDSDIYFRTHQVRFIVLNETNSQKLIQDLRQKSDYKEDLHENGAILFEREK